MCVCEYMFICVTHAQVPRCNGQCSRCGADNIYAHTCTHIYMCMNIRIHVFTHVQVHESTGNVADVCVCACVCVCVCVYVCVAMLAGMITYNTCKGW